MNSRILRLEKNEVKLLAMITGNQEKIKQNNSEITLNNEQRIQGIENEMSELKLKASSAYDYGTGAYSKLEKLEKEINDLDSLFRYGNSTADRDIKKKLENLSLTHSYLEGDFSRLKRALLNKKVISTFD